MAGFDQAPKIRVVLRIRFVIMPARHMQRADSRLAPSIREIVQVDARTIGAVEKRPQTLAAERGIEAEVAQGLQQVRKSLIALLSR